MTTSRKSSPFGETLFNGSRFMFWSLGPLFLLTAIVVTFLAGTKFLVGNLAAGGIMLAAAVVCFCFFLALLNGRHFWWAGRVVAAAVFGAYLWYLLDTWLIHPQTFDIGAPRGRATPWNALLGLVVIGWPSLCYALLGRFTLRQPPPSDDFFAEDDGDSDDAPEQESSNEDRGRRS